MTDNVNRPKHYTSHPSGVECIQITRHMNFNTGNAIKYLWRAGLKGAQLEDLKKAAWYIKDEISRLEAQGGEQLAFNFEEPKPAVNPKDVCVAYELTKGFNFVEVPPPKIVCEEPTADPHYCFGSYYLYPQALRGPCESCASKERCMRRSEKEAR